MPREGAGREKLKERRREGQQMREREKEVARK